MLRDLLVRVSAGLLAGAIAISCSHAEEKPDENVGSIEQAIVGGAGGAAAGAPATTPGGAPDAAGAGGVGGQGPTCDVATCEAPGSCTHCVANVCTAFTLGENHVCRPATDLCDADELCTGATTCPKDDVKAQGTACGSPPAANKPCDRDDICDGTTTVCADRKQPASHECRAIKLNSACDVAENCTGTTDDCPADTFKLDTVSCRTKSGDCDVQDFCTGAGPDCPADAKVADTNPCTDNPNKCLQNTACTAGVCGGGTAKTCADVSVCVAQVCAPVTGLCGSVNKPNTTLCDDVIDCTTSDHCQNGACTGTPDTSRCAKPQHLCGSYSCDPAADTGLYPDHCRMTPKPSGQQCRPAGGICGLAEVCDGATEDCSADVNKDTSTLCQPASCTGNESRPDVKCPGTGPLCTGAGAASSCNGYACDKAACGQTCDDDNGCQPDHYCVNHTCEQRIGAGEKCTDDSQCSTSNSHCVDGVCCDTKCTGQCEACDVKDKEGACSVVTGDPHGKRTACSGDGSACNGSCVGKLRSACEFPNPQTVCLEASCDPQTSMAMEQAFCDGAGNCATTDPMNCTPFTCNATACRGDCVTDAECAAGAFCKAGKCELLGPPGTKCARDAQCGSGFCTDGVCCEARCDGQCQACGSGGTCAPVTGDPVGMRTPCAGDAGEACSGACDGTVTATCAYPAGEVVCRDAACDAGVATVVAHCTSAGACAPEQSVTCKNGCEGTICAGDACLVNSECKDGEHCIAGTCAPQGDDGAACGAAGDCSSGFCVDGVCCESACDGQCQACDGQKPGVCAPVSGAPHGSRVPCTSDGSTCAGSCAGSDPAGCSYPSGTVCGAGSCSPGQNGVEAVATVEADCNGSGRCPAPREQACGGAGCDAKKQLCNGDCADGSACPDGQFCSAGICAGTQPIGTACQAADQCASGFCVDGYCCGSACDDRCAACDVPGSQGECTPVAGSTHGGRAGCQGGGVCGSQCDGKNVTDCAFADKDTSCGAAYCNSGSQVAASSCDGAGQCQPGEQTACASFACDGSECSDACQTDADCTLSMQCHEGTCGPASKINAVDQGTCGCRAPGSHPASHGGWLALLGISLILARRRRNPARAA
jgi:MYXO-CTERM domain-containing protein